MEHMMIDRANGRAANQMRTVNLTRDVMKHALGSCLVEFGDTKVLCAATIEEGVPGWRKGAKAGWVTAEYAMLPASTGKRCNMPCCPLRPIAVRAVRRTTARAAPWRSSA